MQSPTLAQALRDQHAATLVQQAAIIRDWPRGREREEQAEIHVRLALWEQRMGRISSATQRRIYVILSFAMPDDAFSDKPPPIAELEREAAAEAAYFVQLERQLCPECGDGICPAEEQ